MRVTSKSFIKSEERSEMKRSAERSSEMPSEMSLYEALDDSSRTSTSAPRSFKLARIEGAERGLRTRLLELGLVSGTPFDVERRGIHVTLKVRGDRLLLRRAEAHVLKVTDHEETSDE